MESRRQLAAPRAGALVCSVYDNIVRFTPVVWRLLLTLYSVLIPWLTLREVAVHVEIVSHL